MHVEFLGFQSYFSFRDLGLYLIISSSFQETDHEVHQNSQLHSKQRTWSLSACAWVIQPIRDTSGTPHLQLTGPAWSHLHWCARQTAKWCVLCCGSYWLVITSSSSQAHAHASLTTIMQSWWPTELTGSLLLSFALVGARWLRFTSWLRHWISCLSSIRSLALSF